MKRLILFAFFALMNWSTAVSQCVEGDVRLEDPITSDSNSVTGVVQLCTGGEWRTACRSSGYRYWSWDTHAANLVCRQLGYSSEGSTRKHICSEGVNQYIQEIDCNNINTLLKDCSFSTGTECTDYRCDSGKRHAAVTCLRASCADGEVRLVGGSSDREGRVEVCMDGRWGTVCNSNNNGQHLTRAVCSQMRYPPEGAVLRSFPPGIVPVYTCSLNAESTLSCTDTTDSACDHTRDLGVQCLLPEVLEQVLQNNNLTNSCPQTEPCDDTTCTTTESTNEQIDSDMTTDCPQTTPCSCEEDTRPTPSSLSGNEPSVTTSGAATSGNNRNTGGSEQNCTQDGQLQMMNGFGAEKISASVIGLGGVVGVLVVLLVILVIGWSLSCVVLVKRNSNPKLKENIDLDESTDQQRHWDNPVYDTNIESHNYSSSGPTYELMDTNEGAGPTYSALEQARENASSNGAAGTQDEEHHYHVLESGECEGVTGGGCDYEMPAPQQTHSRVMLCEEEYSTLNH